MRKAENQELTVKTEMQHHKFRNTLFIYGNIHNGDKEHQEAARLQRLGILYFTSPTCNFRLIKISLIPKWSGWKPAIWLESWKYLTIFWQESTFLENELQVATNSFPQVTKTCLPSKWMMIQTKTAFRFKENVSFFFKQTATCEHICKFQLNS